MIQKRQRTEKSKYKHQTTGDYCTCSQYIAELMCLRNAQSKNKGSLPYKFWNTKPWDWTFLRQKIAADKLIKQYGESVVMKAVTSIEFEKIFSLNNKRCVSIIEKYAKIQEAIKEEPPKQEIEAKETPELRKRTFGKKKSLNKLRGLDVKKEE